MSEPNNEMEANVNETETNNNPEVTYKHDDDVVNGENEPEHHHDEGQRAQEEHDQVNEQNELYEHLLNEQQTSTHHRPIIQHHNSDRLPTLSRSQINRSMLLKPSIHLSVVNELKYIGPQIKGGKFDPNSRSLNEQIFQRHYQKRLTELETKQKTPRPLSASSHKSLINTQLFQTNDFKFKGSQFRHGKYISPIDLSKENGKTIVTSSSFSNETTFEEKFQRKFQDRLEKLMPKQREKALSYFEIKELQQRFLINNRR